jgi:hypothetical protein
MFNKRTTQQLSFHYHLHPSLELIMFGDSNSVGLVNGIQQQVLENLYRAHTCGLGLPLVDLREMASPDPLVGGGEPHKALFEDIFESHPTVDYSDNAAQTQVIKHHYMSEFGKHISLAEVTKDFSEDAVVHEVVDNVPHTYHGKSGVRQSFRDMFSKIPHDTSHFDIEHIAINHNHAQVIWKAETPTHGVIRGTDSFAFDKDNRIESQTIVALSCKEPKK